MRIRVRFSRAALLLVIATLFATTQLRAQAAAADGERGTTGTPSEIVPPKPLATPLAYPDDATGQATVVLELSLDAQGVVTNARALSGEAPFRAAALSAVPSWRFTPTLRDGRPVAARIRYSVQFTPPAAEAPAAEQPEPAAPSAPRVSAPTVASAPVEVIVEGQRTPIGSVVLTRQDTRALPGSFGDPLRAIEAQPGVVPIVSGLPAFFIRGAPPSNVGFFFDGVEIPLLYHAFFGPSVVHPGFIDAIDFYLRAGFVPSGERFTEAGIAHQAMLRPFAPATSATAPT